MKCPTCGHETEVLEAKVPAKDVMLYVAGSTMSFRCSCGANVFHLSEQIINDKIFYECNGCSRLYEGEK